MKLTRTVGYVVAALVCAGSPMFIANVQASFIPLGNSGYFQDFNYPALPKNGNSKEPPKGWSFVTLAPGNGRDHDDHGQGQNKIHADDGSTASGGVYSYGARQSNDRAFGILTGANGSSGIFGASFENAQSGSINQLDISFTGEEWRLGRAGRQNQLEFQYSLDAHSLTSGDWLNVPSLDFFTPNTTQRGAHNGNLAVNQEQLAGTINFLNIPSGATFWIRWVQAPPFPGGGPGDGLAVDNFSISAVPEVSTVLGGVAALSFLAIAFFRPRWEILRRFGFRH